MENTEIIERTNPFSGEVESHIQISLADGCFVSMLKETYDAQQAEHLNGSVSE